MSALKLVAFDAEDLMVVSVHLQDAVGRIGDMTFLPGQRRFVAMLNRFDWEEGTIAVASERAQPKGTTRYMRRRSALRFEHVKGARTQGFSPREKKRVLSLLALDYKATAPDSPAGIVTLAFSAGASVQLDVECLECEMRDLGPPWRAAARPEHPEIDKQ
jgi:hypothetical protein